MAKIPVLDISGTPYEMGYQHGKAFIDKIREITEERIELCSTPHWTGFNLDRAKILELANISLEAHREFAPELVEELQGIADATDLGLPELIVMNGFTDFVDVVYAAGKEMQQNESPAHAVDDCTAFLVPNEVSLNNQGFFGQTWDMHATSQEYVIMLRAKPSNAPAYMAFTTMGVLGLIGMNEAGVAIGVNNLSGGDGQPTVGYTFVIRKMLAQTNIEDALQILLTTKLAGAHNYLIFDKAGRGYNVEAMSTTYHIEELKGDSIVHTNHCIIEKNIERQRYRSPESMNSSINRLKRGQDILSQRPITPEILQELTRDTDAICVTGTPPMHIRTCGAAIMRPATREMWAVWGLPTDNEYEHFII